MKRMLLLIVLVLWLFCGCVAADQGEQTSGARVVTQVRISLIPDSDTEPFRVYTDEEKIQWVLDYMDSIYGEENPRRAPKNEVGAWRITCIYASGEEREYYLRENKFFRGEDEPWLRIEDSNTGFTQYLLDVPSDQLSPEANPQTLQTTPASTGEDMMGHNVIKVPTEQG